MNTVVVDPSVRQAKIALLPQGVGIASWIERRASTSLAVEPDPSAPDNQIVFVVNENPPEIEAQDTRMAEKEVKMAEREEFFESLPSEEFFTG